MLLEDFLGSSDGDFPFISRYSVKPSVYRRAARSTYDVSNIEKAEAIHISCEQLPLSWFLKESW
ncbi:hypothetical protein SAMN02745220_02108 [Desulfopila aestuarii DSM 18488]|uniref:Uncharacterized protein n=1 Tax=Desulfopila aestuarii DSM 18488 TaxID=1121416 RepID=A0A1M7Y609_9BACT|nr:hypothetical protein SAMN02745220_02108 [Desulfopila aestuarii DSM 18488]